MSASNEFLQAGIRAHSTAVAEGVRVARRVAGTQSRLKSQRRAVSQPAPRTSVEQERPAQVFDAGTHLIVSGPCREAVQAALDKLAVGGGKLISPITQLGNKWMASCAHPRMQECHVEEFGYTRYITGPTREAVTQKVEEFLRFGAVLVGEIGYNDGQWSAVCDTTGSRP
jgi:hypothetical protein